MGQPSRVPDEPQAGGPRHYGAGIEGVLLPLTKTALKKQVGSASFPAVLADRSYMRENPHRSAWSATTILMVALVGCFAAQNIAVAYGHAGLWIREYLALSTEGLTHGYVWQLLTFQFLHAGLFHLVGNLIGLWFLGRFVEERLGTRALLKLYFLSGMAGGVLQAGLGWLAPEHFGLTTTVGASAGVCGLLAGFALLEPDATILAMMVVPIKARHLLWISLGIAGFFTLVPSGGGYAHAAHLGGLLAGMGWMRWDARRLVVPWNPLQARQRKRQLVQAAAQVTRWRPSREKPAEELPPGEFISREVDPILDKISAHGIHSLTPREREILEAARSKMGKQ